MKSVATIKLKIPRRKELLDTMNQYSKAVSYIANKGFEANISNRYALHHLCYYEARNQFKLPSQFVINANRVASQTLKSIKTNKGSKPIFKQQPLAFDKRTFAFSFDKVKLTTCNGRIEIPIEVPECYWKYLDWNAQTALLIENKGRFFLNITFSRDVNIKTSKCNRFLGVDVGINHIAVTSNRKFFSGNEVKRYRLKFKRLRQKLQVKGTRGAKRLLKKISGKERRFKTWVNHNISKQIISFCEAGDTIVNENLKGIRRMRKGRRFNFWLNGWSFYQLQRFISYKAAVRGIKTIQVNPYNTSKTCSRCGKIGSRSKGFFVCSHCGYSLNSDLNASYNLAKHHSISDDVSVAVNQPHLTNNDAPVELSSVKSHILNSKS